MSKLCLKGVKALCCILFLWNSEINARNFSHEKQPKADLENGYYVNPIFPGNYGDPTIVRVENDYYAAFSRNNGIIIFNSRDLVNWRPICRHRLPVGYNRVWAIDIQYFDNKFHVYMPISEYPGKTESSFGNFVITADKPEGPWSEPINLQIPIPEGPYAGIDPGFVQTPEGEKFLYVNHGFAMALNKEGTKAVKTPEEVYKGWQYPQDWTVQCMCLESPKLFYKDNFYYMVSAEGGTNGPSTAHMAVVARAKHPMGPWVNSPYNPIVHTYSGDELFWHQGHGTVFEAADKSWWIIYHGRLKDFGGMGRPTLLMPVEWTSDGWPVIKDGIQAHQLIKMPKGERVTHGLPLSDDFSDVGIGMQWNFKNEDAAKIVTGNGDLKLQAQGTDHASGTSISQYAVNKSFEVSVKVVNASNSNVSGLLLGTEGVATNGEFVFFSEGPEWRIQRCRYPIKKGMPVWLKIVNIQKDVSFFYSVDGHTWSKFEDSSRIENGYTISLFASGSGEVKFQEYKYLGLE